ncbi:MAG: AI-2E family transporter, partial [Candidatus Omnitrophica bacterium]|nr:AI-2E family transporter [Candidatus Omnitrophota bacterium]
LFIISLIGIAFALFWLRPVMIPFILALLFTFILTPIIDFQMNFGKIPRFVAIITTFLLGFIILNIFFVLISASVVQMTSNADTYQEQIIQLIDKVTNSAHFEELGIDANSIVQPFIENVKKGIGGVLVETINAIVKILSKGVLVLIFVLFLLIGRTRQVKLTGIWGESVTRVKRYIVTKFMLSAITGLLVGITLSILHIDLALVFGLFAFLLNFIPSVGSIIATLLPLPVVIVSPDISTSTAIMAIAIPGVIQFAIGNVIEPKIMGDSLDLHPVVILMALIFWGMIWGIVGMFLAAPLTAIMKIIFSKIEFTKSLAELLAGRTDALES